jgi:diadenosine tetraphosphatase ApaH/serine/threonine PP2A family protein phosphatase
MSAGVRGNHDHAVAQRVPTRNGSGFGSLATATRPLHWKALNAAQTTFLARLPVTKRITLDGLSFYLVHATPRDPLDEYLGDDAEAWLERLQAVDADFVCVGHTHVPFHLDMGRLQVVNPGSVGQPRDGDPRCAYAIIENGKVAIRRVEYDVDATLRQMKESGLGPEALELNEAILRTGGKISSDGLDFTLEL